MSHVALFWQWSENFHSVRGDDDRVFKLSWPAWMSVKIKHNACQGLWRNNSIFPGATYAREKKGFCYNNSYKHKGKIFLVVLHLPFIICRHCGPLVLQYFKLYRPLHQYGLYKSTDNVSPTLKTLISSSACKNCKRVTHLLWKTSPRPWSCHCH